MSRGGLHGSSKVPATQSRAFKVALGLGGLQGCWGLQAASRHQTTKGNAEEVYRGYLAPVMAKGPCASPSLQGL